jgi:hypothetical protein
MKMKSLGFVLAVAVLSLSTVAFAQMDAQKTDAQMPDMPKTDTPTSEAQKSFDQLKTLAGTWEGHVTTFPQEPDIGDKRPCRSRCG